MKTIAIWGGTFDPIHNGHLHSALELKQRLGLDELRLLPCHLPPHRQSPGASSVHRLQMVTLAVAGSDLLVDGRELEREQLSYSVESLEQFRQEYGARVSLIWVMGADAFNLLDKWYRWREVLTLAHLVVIARPGVTLRTTGAVAELAASHRAAHVSELQRQACGKIWFESLTPYPVSATAVRKVLAEGKQTDGELPAVVLSYINTHQLYR